MLYLISGDTYNEKFALISKFRQFKKKSKYLRSVHFDIRYGKIVKNRHRKSYFDADYVSDDVTVRLWTLPSIFMFILLREFISYGARYQKQMLCSIRWSYTSAISTILVWAYVFNIDWDIAVQSFNFICYVAPSFLSQGHETQTPEHKLCCRLFQNVPCAFRNLF